MNQQPPDRIVSTTLDRSHVSTPDDVPRLLRAHGRAIGAADVALYLACYDQRYLVPVASEGSDRSLVRIDSTLAGRAYRLVTIETTETAAGGRRVWVPVVDGTERLGVLEVVFDEGASTATRDDVVALANVTAELVLTKTIYGDAFERTRRLEPMSLSAELIWHLVPPLTFANRHVVVSAIMAPPYQVGGDAFDYAVDDERAHVALFDAVGHGLRAGTLATVAIAAYRSCRRRGLDLAASAQAIDEAIATEFGDAYFVTGLLLELELDTGVLSWCCAGHPRPLVLRGDKVVKTLENTGTPWGLARGGWPVAVEQLEPADQVVVFTDGMVEARDADGAFFGMDRFTDFLGRSSRATSSPPEQMRRLLHALLDHQDGALQDDATAVLVEWNGPGLSSLLLDQR